MAPFTGRIGAHLVLVGNLIAGSRAGTSPTTLLATLVSLDPIDLDVDMSETDFLAFSRERARLQGAIADKVEIALSDEAQFARQGPLDFVDNALDGRAARSTRAPRFPTRSPAGPGRFARVRLAVGASVQVSLVPPSPAPTRLRSIKRSATPCRR